MKIPDNQLEFEKMFTKEEHCLEYLYQVRFLDGYIVKKMVDRNPPELYWWRKPEILSR
jgi:hypothetical protein